VIKTLAVAALTAAVLAAPSAVPSIAGTPAQLAAQRAAQREVSAPLDILLVNDDGWRGEGGASTPLIVAMRNALAEAGYHVVVVAPGTDQSGQGGRISLPPLQLTVANPEEDVWTISPGSPADSVFFAMDEVFADDKPDLVISGINPGNNSGQAVNHSGTVNAAATALEFGVPSLAVSLQTRPDWAGGVAAATPGAVDYVGRLVRRIQRAADGGRLMPDGAMLNVNLPVLPGPLDPGTGQPGSVLPPKGERVTTVATSIEFGFDYANSTGAEGTYRIGFAPVDSQPARGTDIRAVRDGYVSLTPLEADRDVDPATRAWLASLL
jgi:5'-nucleotidase